MSRFIIILGVIFMVAPIRAQNSSKLGKVKLEIEAFEDRTIYAKTRIVPLKNLRASEIEPFIRSRLSIYGAVQVNDATNTLIITDLEPKLSDLMKLVKELDAKGIKEFVRLETRTLHPKYVLPSKLVSILERNLSPDGSIYVDNDLNAIMITDVTSRIERIKEILAKLDAPPKQVLIEGKLVVAESDWLRKMGVDHSSMIGNIRVSGDAYKLGLYTGELDIWSSGRLNIGFRGMISLGVEEGKVNVSSFPTLIVQNNKEGEVHISDYYNHSTFLSFIPHIGEDNFINLEISLQTGSSSYLTPRPKKTITSTSGQGITTTIMVKDGKTFTLGGIEYIEESIEEKGIPILRSIPVLGWLFKRETKVTTKKELVALITPHILEFGESPKIEKK